MSGVELASAYIALIPRMKADGGATASAARQAGRRAGRSMGEGYAEEARRSVKGGPVGPDPKSSEAAGKRSGERFGSGFSNAVRSLTAGLGAVMAVEFGRRFLSGAVSEASNLEQSVGGLEAVFRKSFGAMSKASESAALNLGLSRNEYNELATTLGSTLKNKGIDGFAEKTRGLIKTGADLSSMFGGTTREAVNALSSAMRGEMDPIERYGVTMNQTMLEAEAYAAGIVKRTKDTGAIKKAQNDAILAQRKYNDAVKEHGEGSDEAISAESRLLGATSRLNKAMAGKKVVLTDNQKAQAALSLITKQTTTSTGNFAKESDTLTGQQQRLNAQIANIKASIGKFFIPYLTKGATKLNEFLSQMQDNKGVGGKFRRFMTDTGASVRRLFASFEGKKGGSGELKASFSSLSTGVVDLMKNLPSLKPTIDAVGTSLKWVARHSETVGKLLPWILGAFVMYKTLQAANNVLGRDSAIGMGIQLASTISLTLANRSLAKSMDAVATSQKKAMVATRQATASENVSRISKLKSTLATLRQTIAEKAKTVATKIATAAQRVFNAVMNMSPLGKIILVITLLGTALFVLYKKNETFRKFVQKSWAAIQAKIGQFADWFSAKVIPVVSLGLKIVGTAAMGLWRDYIQPAFSKIWDVMKRVFVWAQRDAIPGFTRALKALGQGAMWLWRNALVPAFTGVARVVTWMWKNVTGPILRVMWSTLKRVFGWVKDYGYPAIAFAFKAIGAVVGWLWRRVVGPAFAGIWSLVKRVFGWIKNTGGPWVEKSFKGWGIITRHLWSRAIRPYFTRIWGLIRRTIEWVRDRGWPTMKLTFRLIGDSAKFLWSRGIRPAFNRIKAGAKSVQDAFTRAKQGIARVWGGLKNAVARPISAALKWIDDHFLSKLRNVLGSVGLGSLADKIPHIGGGSPKEGGGFKGGGKFNTGGRVGGYSPHDRADNIPAWLTAGEFVTRVASVRRMKKRHPGALEHINRYGELPRYAIGGDVVGLNKAFFQKLAAFNAAAGGKYSVVSGLRTRAEQERLYAAYLNGTGNLAARPGTSRHESGLAADLSPSNARDVNGGLARRFGLWFPVPGEAWHIEPIGGRKGGPVVTGGGGMFGGLAGRIIDQGRKALDAILNRAPKDLWTQMGVGAVRQMSSVIVDKVRGAAATDDGGALTGSSAKGSASTGVAKWRSVVLQALRLVGQPASLVDVVLRRMNQESGGNPRAINNWDSNAAAGDPSKGLMQVIGSTFRAYAMAGHNRDIYDPLSNILASMRYALARYGSLSAAYNRAGGYSSGGLVKALEFDRGGYLPTGHSLVVNNTGKPEPLGRLDTMGRGNLRVYVENPFGGGYLEARFQEMMDDQSDFDEAVGRMNG